LFIGAISCFCLPTSFADSASHAGLEQWSQAADDAKECIRLYPTFLKGYYRLATALVELKQHELAINIIEQGLVMDSTNVQLQKQLRQVKQLHQALAKKQHQQQSLGASTAVSPAGVGSGNMLLDETSAREFQEINASYQQTARDYQISQANLHKYQREYQIAELTSRELSDVATATVDATKIAADTSCATSYPTCYRSIGKMFLKTPYDEVQSKLEQQMKECQNKEQDIQQQMVYLEKKLESQKKNMNELLVSRQQ
jgi:chaperonin cofactor prefoldin